MNPTLTDALRQIRSGLAQLDAVLAQTEEPKPDAEYVIMLTKGMIEQSLVCVTDIVNDGAMPLDEPLLIRCPQTETQFTTHAVTSTIRLRERSAFTTLFKKTEAKDGMCLNLSRNHDKSWTIKVSTLAQSLKATGRKKISKKWRPVEK